MAETGQRRQVAAVPASRRRLVPPAAAPNLPARPILIQWIRLDPNPLNLEPSDLKPTVQIGFDRSQKLGYRSTRGSFAEEPLGFLVINPRSTLVQK